MKAHGDAPRPHPPCASPSRRSYWDYRGQYEGARARNSSGTMDGRSKDMGRTRNAHLSMAFSAVLETTLPIVFSSGIFVLARTMSACSTLLASLLDSYAPSPPVTVSLFSCEYPSSCAIPASACLISQVSPGRCRGRAPSWRPAQADLDPQSPPFPRKVPGVGVLGPSRPSTGLRLIQPNNHR